MNLTPAYRRVDQRLNWVWRAVNERQVGLDDLSILELSLQRQLHIRIARS